MSKEQVSSIVSRNETPDIDVWNVDNAIEAPSGQSAADRRRAEQDWNNYLKSRDYVDEDMNVHDAATGELKDVDIDARGSTAYYDAKANESVAETSRSDKKITELIESARAAHERGDETMLDDVAEEINAKLNEMGERHGWDRETSDRHTERIADIIEGRSKRQSDNEVINDTSGDQGPEGEDNSQEKAESEDGKDKDEDDSSDKDQGSDEPVPIEPIPVDESEAGEGKADKGESSSVIPIEPIPLGAETSDGSVPVPIEPIPLGAQSESGNEPVPIEPIPLDKSEIGGDEEEDALLERADEAASNYARLNARGRVKRGILNRNKYKEELAEARKQWQEHTKNLIQDELSNVDLSDVAEKDREAHLENLRNEYSRNHSNRLLGMTEYYERAIAPKEGGRKKLKALAVVAFVVGFATKIVTKYAMEGQGVDFQTADIAGNVAAAGAGAAAGVVYDHNNIKYRRISEVGQGDNGVIIAAEQDRKDDQELLAKNQGSLEETARIIEDRTEKVRKDNRNRALGNFGLGALFGLLGGASSEMIKGEKGDQGDQGIQGIEGPRGPEGIEGPKGDEGADGLAKTGV